MTSMRKRLLSLMMSLVMLVSLLPLSTLAAGSTETSDIQIKKGSSNETLYYVDANDEAGSSESWVYNNTDEKNSRVQVSKVINGTDTENVFDITLDVKAKQKVTSVATAPDAAVTLVMDISGSMQYCSHCGARDTHDRTKCSAANGGYYISVDNTVQQYQTKDRQCTDCKRSLGHQHKDSCSFYKNVDNSVKESQSRWAAALAAAKQFAKEFKNSAITYPDENGIQHTTKRLISVVVFQSYAEQWYLDADPSGTDVTWLNLSDDQSLTQFNAAMDRISTGGSTNVADGLSIASEGMDTLFANANDYGADQLTRGSSYLLLLGDGEPNASVAPPDYDFMQWYYPQYSNKLSANFVYAEQWIRKIRGDGTKVISAYAGTNSSDSGYQWFQTFDPNCQLASKVTDLVEAFSVSLTLLRLNTKAWIVTDALGSNVSYLNGGGANVAPGQNDKTVTWTLRMDTPEVWQDGKKVPLPSDLSQLTGNYELHYSTTYRVKLDSAAAGATQDALASNATSLKYYLTDENENFVDEAGNAITVPEGSDDEIAEAVLLSLAFKNPKVHALTGSFQFEKQAFHTNAPLPGAEFRAILKDSNPEANYGGQQSSGANGVVQFSGLPSGQSYRIHEQVAPTDYDLNQEDEQISVSWGMVYYNGKLVSPNTNAYVYKNKLTQTYTDFTVTKQWFDGNNASRPGSITIDLQQYEDGVLDPNYTNSIVLSSSDAVVDHEFQWRKTINNLPAINVETGKTYTYKAVEKNVPKGYTSDSGTDANVITNVAESTTTVSGTKTWIDPVGTNHPDVVIQLLADGQPVPGKSVTLNNGETTYTFQDLPKFRVDGQGINGTIQYTVREENVPTGYSSEPGTGQFDLINRINQAYAPIDVSVAWLDNSNAYSTRPDSVEVSLYADGKQVGEPVTITGEKSQNTWAYTFEGKGNQTINGNPVDGFPVYKVVNGTVTGERIVYSMKQTAVKSLDNGDHYVLKDSTPNVLSSTNVLTGETEVSGSKTWVVPNEFKDYPEVIIKLSNQESTTLDKNNTFAFKGLAKYNETGVLNTYSVQEVIVGDGQTKFSKNSITKNPATGTWNLENEYHDSVTISGTKTWLDDDNAYKTRPATLDVQLYANGTPVDGKTMKISEDNGWAYSFKDLEKYSYTEKLVKEAVPSSDPEMDEEGNTIRDGNPGSPAVYETVAEEIVYSVQEVGIIQGTLDDGDSYSYVTSGGTAKENYNLTNTLTGKTTISGTKTWLDQDNAYGTRPEAGAEIKLYRNSDNVALFTTNTASKGSYEFKDVDKFDASGVKYVYSVKETPVAGYTTKQEGWNFTNTLAQQFTSYAGTKIWIDGGRKDHPAITVYLQQNGTDYGDPIILQNGTTQFTFGVSDQSPTLPVFQYDATTGDVTGQYTYSLREDKVDGYTTEIQGNQIFNTIEGIHNTTGLTFEKYWVAPQNYSLPEAIFTVYQNGAPYGELIKSTDMKKTDGGFYTYSLTNLPLYSEDGNTAYTYTVEETGVPDGFTMTKLDGNRFRNQIDPGSVTLEGKKTWDSPPSSYNIQIQVFRDGEAAPFYTTEISSEEAEFTFTVGGEAEGKAILPKYAPDGKEYAYTMKEVPVEGYTVKQDGNQFTNTYQQFPYQIVAHYTATVDGKVVVNGETKEIQKGNPGYFEQDARSVAIDPERYKSFTAENGSEYAYTFAGATLKIGNGEATSFSGNTLSLSIPDQMYTLDINYTYTQNAPVTHSVTVNYYDYARHQNGTPTRIANSRSISGVSGSTYDASVLNAIGISGYTYVETTGDSLVGTLDGDKTINVWYNVRSGGGGGGPNSGGGTQQPPTTDIPDTDPPLTDLPTDIPDENPPLAELPKEEVTEIAEEEVPMAIAPKTGDESKGGLWLSLMALTALGIAALANIGKKPKDETEDQ